jgi:alpha-mannosidase
VIGVFKATSVRLVEHGAVKSVIRVISAYNHSILVQDFTMYPDGDRVDVYVTVDWREQLKALKLRFPINVYFMKITHEIAYGHLELFANGEETPFQSWIDVSGIAYGQNSAYGLSLLNDGKYSVDVDMHDIGLTVLRSPAYAHHIPTALKPDGHYAYLDQGIQRFSYALLPHTGSWERAGTVQHAAQFNQPPTVLLTSFHPNGTLPQSQSFIKNLSINQVGA